jgi:branched-chain amino acid transport system permease protein
MSWQFLIDGTVNGALIGLGAVGVTLTYAILRFANFAHGELIASGAYVALLIAAAVGAAAGGTMPFEGLSFGWPLLAALVVAMVLTGLFAIGLDRILFRRLRETSVPVTVVMASFGASMALRASLEFIFTSSPRYYSDELQIAWAITDNLRITPDQIVLLGLTAILVLALHLLLTRTQTGRAMRAVSENPALASITGIDPQQIVRLTWFIGGALACASGVFLGLVVQIRPYMGYDMLLPLFAAAILGGIGSVPGALIGALIIGIAEAATVDMIGSQWRAAVSFLALIAVLLVRPAGLLGSNR